MFFIVAGLLVILKTVYLYHMHCQINAVDSQLGLYILIALIQRPKFLFRYNFVAFSLIQKVMKYHNAWLIKP